MREFLSKLRKCLDDYLTLGWIGAAAAVAGAINSIVNTPDTPTQPSGPGQAGFNALYPWAQNILQTSGNTALPNINSAYSRLLGIDPTSYLSAGSQAGGQYSSLGNLAQIYSQLLGNRAGITSNAAQNLYGAGDQLWRSALDPQQDMYKKRLQEVTDRANLNESMRGLAMSPYSSALTDEAQTKFTQNWDYDMLNRILMGLRGMTTAYNAAGNQGELTGANLSGSLNFGSQVPQATLASGQTPFATQQQVFSAPLDYSNQFLNSINQNFVDPALGVAATGQNAANSALPWAQLNTGLSSNATNALFKGLTNLNTSANTPGSWLNTAGKGISDWLSTNFGGGGNQTGSTFSGDGGVFST
jgi:hypothetical protein